ncbi:uncharacterized protein LOC119871823 isoform X3 [Canis lupus familiaris]|nr:uncharacterized protein LOC119871823 isoform X3 [Canis lupus familiaris]XP_038520965.1 uncharacterized protein LOC119871823 isoform X3 [Canis lupus familiaris]
MGCAKSRRMLVLRETVLVCRSVGAPGGNGVLERSGWWKAGGGREGRRRANWREAQVHGNTMHVSGGYQTGQQCKISRWPNSVISSPHPPCLKGSKVNSPGWSGLEQVLGRDDPQVKNGKQAKSECSRARVPLLVSCTNRAESLLV